MKVLFLINHNNIGGAEYVSLQHYKELVKAGHDVEVISAMSGNFYSEMKAIGGDKVHLIKNLHDLYGAEVIKVLKPHVVRAEVVYNCNYFDMTRYVAQIHKEHPFKYATIAHSPIDWTMDNLTKYDDITDSYIAITEQVKKRLMEYGVSEYRITVIPNCIETNRIEKQTQRTKTTARKALGITTKYVVGMVTRVSADKNITEALNIFSSVLEHVDATLLIIGGSYHPDYKLRVEKLIEKLNLKDRVIITGNVDSDTVYKNMQAFDIGLNTSVSEGLPIALIEMMCAGITCVFPTIGGIPELLNNNNGYLVKVKHRLEIGRSCDPLTLTEQREYILTIIKALHRQNGSVARAQIIEHRDINSITAKLVQALQPIKFSVLMPVKDVPPVWLNEAIGSILNQTYQNFELVIVNDGSNNETSNYLNSLRDKRIKVVSLPASMGTGTALNIGIAHANNDYIVRMDGDDIVDKKLLYRHFQNLTDNPHAQVVGIQLETFNNRPNDYKTNHPKFINKGNVMKAPNPLWWVNHGGIMYKKETIIKAGGYPNYTPSQDFGLWCKLIKAGLTVYNLPDVLYRYRIHDKQTVKKTDVKKLEQILGGVFS